MFCLCLCMSSCRFRWYTQIPQEGREERRERESAQKALILAGKFHLFVIYLYSKCNIMMVVYKKGGSGAKFRGLGSDMVLRVLSQVVLEGK